MRRSVPIIVSAVALLTVAVLLLRTAIPVRYDKGAELELSAELEAWKSIGGVTNPADLVQPIPGGDNAAVIYGDVYDELVGIHTNAAEILSDPTVQSGELDALIENASPLIDLLAKAASIDRCIWTQGSATGIEALSSDRAYLTKARLLAKFLAANAAVAHRDGQHEHAMDSIRRMFMLADHVVAAPGILQLLTSLAIDQLAFRLLKELFRDQAVPMPVGSARERKYRDRLRRALLAEGAWGISVFDDPSFAPDRQVKVFGWSIDRDKAYYVRTMRLAVESIEEPYYERRTLSDPETPRWALISDTLRPYMKGLHHSVAWAETRLLLLESALQLRQYRRQNGEYPAEWPSPTDPLTGQPFQFERVGHGIVIRSGANAEAPESSGLQWQWN